MFAKWQAQHVLDPALPSALRFRVADPALATADALQTI